MIKIVEAEEKHMPAVLDIEQIAFTPSWIEGALLNEMGQDDAFFSVAVEDEAVLGFCVLHQVSDEGELYQIAVDECARRRGIADMLMSAAVEYAEKKGIISIFLEVRSSNEPAISLYKKHGFIRVGRRKKYYDWPVEDAVIMELKIKQEAKRVEV